MQTSISVRLYKFILYSMSKMSFLNFPIKGANIILCYHDIDDDKWEFSTSILNFEKQIKYLNRHFKIVKLSDMLGKDDSKENRLSITFDDGYQSVHKNAFPILKRLGLTGTVFITGGKNNVNYLELGNKKKLLTYTEIKKLHKSGWEIGFHTQSHSNLTQMNTLQLTNEVLISKNKLSNRLKIPLNYFAYPKGLYNKKILREVKKANYKGAFTINGYKSNVIRNNLLINRISMSKSITDIYYKQVISPLGLIINMIFVYIWRVKDSIKK